jgi:predicted Zn-dependent protease
MANKLFAMKLGCEQETDADLAKIDPSGMITFLERLSEKDQGRMEWLSTHPMSAARAKQLKAELAALPKKSLEPFDL